MIQEPNCQECTLSGPKVYGSGSEAPRIVFVGEAPGYHEVEQGMPFVGMAGKVIRTIISYLGIPDDAVYLTNVCLCRPPENREPSAQEIKACWPRLEAELLQLNPEMVVALGAIPSRVLFPEMKLKDDHGKPTKNVLGQRGIVTYHPAATLYPKGETIFPFLLHDIQKVWRILSGGSLPPEYTDSHTEVFIADTDDKVASVIKRMMELPYGTTLAFDWETTGTKPHIAVGFCLGFSWKHGTAVVVPDALLRKHIRQFAQVFQRFTLAGFNALLFDSLFNRKLGLSSDVVYDGQLLHYMLDERPQKRSLENLTVNLLDAPAYESEMLARNKCSKAEMLQKVPPYEVYEYCGKDCDWSLRLVNYLRGEIKSEPGLLDCYQRLIVPGARAFADIGQRGVWVDRAKLENVTDKYEQKLIALEFKLSELTGDKDFNPRSHPQVQKFLWDELDLEEPEIYGRKPRSADKETLKALSELYPEQDFVDTLAEYRTTYTLYSRYLRGLPEYIDADGRVRASYHFDRTETGRLSTTDPALHQTPRESDIRTVYAAPEGFTLLQADYEQQEMRMAAHVAQDKKLTALFQELAERGEDFHRFMASKAFKVPIDQVTPRMRQAAKPLSFGILYRMSPKGLAVQTGLPKKEALQFIKDYEALMPGVMEMIAETEHMVKTQQYVESIFGRRRRFPFITSRNLAGLIREAVNFRVQSPASDLTLSSLIKLHQLLREHYPEAFINIMVHDSIVVECPIPLVGEVGRLMLDVMQTPPFETDVPFPVELKVGTHWGEGEVFTA